MAQYGFFLSPVVPSEYFKIKIGNQPSLVKKKKTRNSLRTGFQHTQHNIASALTCEGLPCPRTLKSARQMAPRGILHSDFFTQICVLWLARKAAEGRRQEGEGKGKGPLLPQMNILATFFSRLATSGLLVDLARSPGG